MPRVGFQLTTPAFERAKTVPALDSAATVIGSHLITNRKMYLREITTRRPRRKWNPESHNKTGKKVSRLVQKNCLSREEKQSRSEHSCRNLTTSPAKAIQFLTDNAYLRKCYSNYRNVVLNQILRSLKF
jgi:hypothetical protein